MTGGYQTTIWKPAEFHQDPMVNAVLNLAHAVMCHASETRELLYAFKYGREEGMSVAEAIETVANRVGEPLNAVADALESLQAHLPKEKR